MADRETVGVLVVCEDTLERAGLKALLSGRPGLNVVGEAGGLAGLPPLVTELNPDVIVDVERSLDTHAADSIGRVMKCVNGSAPVRMIVLTSVPGDFAVNVMRGGCCAVLDKKISSDELVAAIRLAAAGYLPVKESLMVNLARAAVRLRGSGKGAADHLGTLTRQERRVLLLIIQGLSNPEIAADLTVAESTVKSHVQSILKKLSLRDRAQIIIYAYEGGLVSPSR